MSKHFFLKLEGVEGESQHHKHKGEIEIGSMTWGAAQDVSMEGNGLGAGRVEIHSASFTANMCKASPKLALACASGQRFAQAVFTVHDDALGDVLIYRFSNASVDSFTTGGSPHGIPVEQFSLHCDRIEVEYREKKSDGKLGPPVKSGWDLTQGCAI
jgi:type VI secretion system secreted protein Hcp